jgi:hypothetical protein
MNTLCYGDKLKILCGYAIGLKTTNIVSLLINGTIICLLLTNAACQQLSRTATKPGEVSVSIEFLGKQGTSSSYRLPFDRIPNHRNIPNNYQLLPGNTYEVTTTALEYGEAIVTFAVPSTSPEQFQTLRVLKLVPSAFDLDPAGVVWTDCTITTRGVGGNTEVKLTERQNKFLPDLQTRKISCAVTDRFNPDNYFAIAYIKEELAPIATEITGELTKIERSDDNDQTTYTLSLTNAGPRDLEEVNFHSDFDVDGQIVSFEPEHGRCKISSWGSSDGAVACYVGPLAKGEHVLVKLVAKPSNFGGLPPNKKFNDGWSVIGLAKAKVDDYSGSVFELRPLLQN